MYIHAYQSYVWNAIVSERIGAYGAGSPVVGDLVYEEPPKKIQEEAVNKEETEVADDLGSDTSNDHSIILCSPFSRWRGFWRSPCEETMGGTEG